MILSVDDEPGQPTPALLDFALDSVRRAREISLADIAGRLAQPPLYPDVWPGEHYRLLAGMVQSLQPQTVIEVGTFQGLSALALKKFLPPGGQVVTFDLGPWAEVPGTYLRPEDFADGRLRQVTGDLGNRETAFLHRELLQRADLIFMDAAKDGHLETRLLENFRAIGLPKNPWLVFDDIRVWNMLATWRSISQPKLDLTSFGHWSGTGIVAWS